MEQINIQKSGKGDVQHTRKHWDIVLNPVSQRLVQESNCRKETENCSPESRILVQGKEGSSREAAHTCSYCNRMFGQASNLNKHIRVVHWKLRPFSCMTCSKTFAQRSVARNHFRSVHLGERPFLCALCEKQFSDKSNLKKHVKLVHFKEKNHTCTRCSKKFGERRSLKDHISSVHLKQKPHSCPVADCKARFGQKSHLSTHLKSRHPLRHCGVGKRGRKV